MCVTDKAVKKKDEKKGLEYPKRNNTRNKGVTFTDSALVKTIN